MTFLEKLDEKMREMGINKNKLSQLSGVPYTTIDGFYKKGYDNAKISTLKKIASALDVSLDYLVVEQDETKKEPVTTEGDRLYDRIAGLDPDLQQQLIEFVALAQVQPEIAKRHLAFAVGELRSAQQAR